MTRKTALITGITGQDGSYLAELLLDKGYSVHGIVRHTSVSNTVRIDHLLSDAALKERIRLHYGNLRDSDSIRHAIESIQPDEIYNLGAQSHVRDSFDQPENTVDITGTSVIRILEAVRDVQAKTGNQIRYYQAGSSEMFGSAKPPQHETTRFEPRSPYACAKVYAHYQVVNYRESYGLFAANGILFNHESPRRGETFVTRKITKGAARIKLGLQDKLSMGNLDVKRDWGFAGDYVDAMWRILQHDEPDDFAIATGESHSLREFLQMVFSYLDLDWNDYVEIDPRFFRPADVPHVRGDASKARELLGWEPKHTLQDIVRMMVDADLAAEGSKTGPTGAG